MTCILGVKIIKLYVCQMSVVHCVYVCVRVCARACVERDASAAPPGVNPSGPDFLLCPGALRMDRPAARDWTSAVTRRASPKRWCLCRVRSFVFTAKNKNSELCCVDRAGAEVVLAAAL